MRAKFTEYLNVHALKPTDVKILALLLSSHLFFSKPIKHGCWDNDTSFRQCLAHTEHSINGANMNANHYILVMVINRLHDSQVKVSIFFTLSSKCFK